MEVVVTGASGFIGRALTAHLAGRGDTVVAVTRSVERARGRLPRGVEPIAWHPPDVDGEWVDRVAHADAVVNLAGEPVADKRWTDVQKRKILQSRLDSTNAIVEALGNNGGESKVLVNGSAVGYYGSRGDEVLTEGSPPGNDFLASVVQKWEGAALPARERGVRVALIRTAGLVLGGSGGALPRLALPFKLFGGGVMGPHKQFVSWIHIDDEVGIICKTLDDAAAAGPINACAPTPVTMEVFSHALGEALHRPVWVPALPVVMKLALGQRADVVFASQRVVPARPLSLGYAFRHADLTESLRSLLTDA